MRARETFPDPAAQVYAAAVGIKVGKYAELITRPCGRCTMLISGSGTVEHEWRDPDCETHREFRCAKCGQTVDGATITHGQMDPTTWHKPVEGARR